jgi:hypothetical protein
MAAIERYTGNDVETLIHEIDRYLAVVSFFRSEGCEPAWRTDAARSEPYGGENIE